MDSENEAVKQLINAILNAPVGSRVRCAFEGIPLPVDVTMKFAGGWEISYTLIPGQPLELIRGEDAYLDDMDIHIRDYDGLHQQV